MISPVKFSLLELDRLLPITNRDLLLRWLKERYTRALDAIDYGFNGAVIIQKDGFMVTAEELIQYIDVKHGWISEPTARFLIHLIEYQVLPASLVINQKQVNPQFQRFAFPEKNQFHTGAVRKER